MAESFLLIGLTLLASLSPLLTFATLWQVKEWRLNRLLEHLRHENALLQLLGRVRPLIVLVWLPMNAIPALDRTWLLIGCLSLLAGLTVIQIALRRQRFPVWTHKTKILTAGAMLLSYLIALFFGIPYSLITNHYSLFVLPFLVLLQPLFLTLIWIAFYPIDRLMKRRVMDRARTVRNQYPDLTVVGVTGSVGKTTTKELIAHIVSDLEPLATPAHVNSELGIAQWMIKALPAFAASHSQGIVIVEMGAYRKGEIKLMSSYVRQNVSVVTHVGTQHIALFGSQQNLFEGKSELVTSLPTDGHAFLNGDNEFTRKMNELSPCPVTIVGTGGPADLQAYDIEETGSGIRFTVEGHQVKVPLNGTHNVTNILLAIAVARHLEVGWDVILRQLGCFRPLSRTFQVRESSGVKILDDTHNASAASLKAAIAWAKVQPFEQKALLFAGLIEMGEEQAQAEIELGALAAPVFSRAIVIDAQSAKNFREGFGKEVETLNSLTGSVNAGSLLVCVGRMPPSTINRLLPNL